MPKKFDPAQYQATSQTIIDTARQLMAEHGTAGLTIRSIAKQLEVSPPAIYHYFASQDDLITALIVYAYNSMADELEKVCQEFVEEGVGRQLIEVALMYRRWALIHPADFQLIYDSPIPGYCAPEKITSAAAGRSFRVLINLLEKAIKENQIQIPDHYRITPSKTTDFIMRSIEENNYPVSAQAVYLGVIAWSHLHGMVVLELFQHLQHIVGDVEDFYHLQNRNLLFSFGIKV